MTTPQNNGGPIAPSMITRQRVAPDTVSESRIDVEGGLTLRDYFAAAALQGMLANPDFNGANYAKAAGYAFSQADAMLAARERKEDA